MYTYIHSHAHLYERWEMIDPHSFTLQHAATRCNTLQHVATHGTTLQHTSTHCNTLHLTYTSHCNTQRNAHSHTRSSHTRTYIHMCTSMRYGEIIDPHSFTLQHTATHCITLQHTAIHCNTLQHTAPNIHFTHRKIHTHTRTRRILVHTFICAPL